MKGIDVSRWQEGIDFNAVRAAGYDFVILKAGGSDDGFYTDRCFESFYDQARTAGLYIGAYYFVGPEFTSAEDGRADAERFIRILGNRLFEMPVFVDIECTRPADKGGVTEAAIAFCETMEEAGYYVGIYASECSGFRDRLDAKRLTNYTWWVAAWGDAEPDIPYGIWQYNNNGRVGGVTVDEDAAVEEFRAVIAAGGYNNYSGRRRIAERLNIIRDEISALIDYVER